MSVHDALEPVFTMGRRTQKAVSRPLPLSNVSARSSAPTNAETLLKAVAAELGLGQAVLILAAERVRVRAIIGG
jgi:hypothetical protein